jgi:lysine 6-dehydrogenase
MKARITNLDYKTVRYVGHCELIRGMVQLGMASSEPIEVGGVQIRPVDLFSELLWKNLPTDEKDLVLLRVTVVGRMKGKVCKLLYELTDYYDEKTQMTAMMRTTGFPASIIAQMLAGGRIERKGVVPQEFSVPPEEFVKELKKRGIAIRETESAR